MTLSHKNSAESGLRSGPKLERLLGAAADLMARRGYGQTSIRHVARETGFSLAGMYYYFKNKEDLLYQIQHRTFSSLLEIQERTLGETQDAEQKLRQLVRNHLEHFTHHFNELKVCTFELHSLQDQQYQDIETLRRRYYRCLAGVIRDILDPAARGAQDERLVRHHTLFVFGMLNWIFMWYDQQRDAPVEELGEEMLSLILNGLRDDGQRRRPRRQPGRRAPS